MLEVFHYLLIREHQHTVSGVQVSLSTNLGSNNFLKLNNFVNIESLFVFEHPTAPAFEALSHSDHSLLSSLFILVPDILEMIHETFQLTALLECIVVIANYSCPDECTLTSDWIRRVYFEHF